MNALSPTSLRVVAAVLAVGTVAWIPLSGQWTADNAFLIPDLLFGVGLIAGALWPDWRTARVVLAVSYPVALGVLITAVATWVIAGRFPVLTIVGVLMAAFGTALLARELYVTVASNGRRA